MKRCLPIASGHGDGNAALSRPGDAFAPSRCDSGGRAPAPNTIRVMCRRRLSLDPLRLRGLRCYSECSGVLRCGNYLDKVNVRV